MLKVNFINLGSEIYYTEMLDKQQGSYYVKNHGSLGVFRGNGSTELEIENRQIGYQDQGFINLVNGESIDGKTKLRTIYKERTYFYLTDPKTKRKTTISRKKAEELVTKNADKYRRLITHKIHKPVGCIDLTFSAPKSFSIYHALAPTKGDKQKVLDAFQNAINDTTSAIEQNCFIRRGKNGVNREQAKVILGDFIHHVARPVEKHQSGDMQLHVHRLALSSALGKDGKWGAICTHSLNEARYSIGQAFINNLRYRTEHDLGLATYDRQLKHGTTFEIAGISPELVQEFSQRSQAIAELVEPSMTPAQIDKLVLKTRLKKVSDYPDLELVEDWQHRAKKHQFSWEEVAKYSQSLKLQQQQKSEQIQKPLAKESVLQTPESVPKPETQYKPKETPVKAVSTPRQREKLYQELATELQVSQPRGGFKQSFLLSKVLEQSKGSYKEAQAVATDFERSYTRPSRVKHRLRLNYLGHRLIDFAGVRRRIAKTIKRIHELHKELKNFSTSAKMLYLYATGKISRKQWQIIRRRKELYRSRFERKISREQYVLALDGLRKEHEITPDYVFLIRSYEAAGILSHKKSQYWAKILLEAKEYREAERVKKQLTQWEERSLEIGRERQHTLTIR